MINLKHILSQNPIPLNHIVKLCTSSSVQFITHTNRCIICHHLYENYYNMISKFKMKYVICSRCIHVCTQKTNLCVIFEPYFLGPPEPLFALIAWSYSQSRACITHRLLLDDDKNNLFNMLINNTSLLQRYHHYTTILFILSCTHILSCDIIWYILDFIY